MILLLFVGIWIGLFFLSHFYKVFGSVSIIINFIQVTAVLSVFQLGWPVEVNNIYSFFAFFNWNFKLITGMLVIGGSTTASP